MGTAWNQVIDAYAVSRPNFTAALNELRGFDRTYLTRQARLQASMMFSTPPAPAGTNLNPTGKVS